MFMSVYIVLLFEMFASEQFSDAGGWWAEVHGITQRIDHVNLKSGQAVSKVFQAQVLEVVPIIV